MSLVSMLSRPLKYCSINVRSLGDATRLVVMVTPFYDSLIQLILVEDL